MSQFDQFDDFTQEKLSKYQAAGKCISAYPQTDAPHTHIHANTTQKHSHTHSHTFCNGGDDFIDTAL